MSVDDAIKFITSRSGYDVDKRFENEWIVYFDPFNGVPRVSSNLSDTHLIRGLFDDEGLVSIAKSLGASEEKVDVQGW